MASSSRFIVAVHVLSLLAFMDKPVTSEFIAGSVNTNPVVIRRVIGLLAKARLVNSSEGAAGGTSLARSTDKITLADVHRAVEGGFEVFGQTRHDPNPACPVGRNVQAVLRSHTDRVEATMRSELNKTTIADVLAGIRAASR